MSHNHGASLSQSYIEHLKEKTLEAENRLKEETKEYEVNNNQLTDATNWKTVIDTYWNRVKSSQELVEDVFTNIDNLLKQATKVNANMEFTLEAIQLLVCNVREVSLVLEAMTDRYHHLKSHIDKVVTRDKSFKKDKIYEKLMQLGDKLTAAGQAAETAITKVLDLVKVAFVLHRSIDSERKQHQDWIVDHVFIEYIDENGHLKPLQIYETTEVICGEKTIEEPGLEWQIKKLDDLLNYGMQTEDHPHHHFHDDEDEEDDAFLASDDNDVPTFPLNDGEERYYNITHKQYRKAVKMVKHAKKQLEIAEAEKRQADSSHKAFKAALDAADAAKTGKK